MRDRPAGRLVLLTTRGATDFPGVGFQPDDILLFGRESAGVPADRPVEPKPAVDAPTDVLRLACHLSGGDVTLEKNASLWWGAVARGDRAQQAASPR